jgi:hypothetical protein
MRKKKTNPDHIRNKTIPEVGLSQMVGQASKAGQTFFNKGVKQVSARLRKASAWQPSLSVAFMTGWHAKP